VEKRKRGKEEKRKRGKEEKRKKRERGFYFSIAHPGVEVFIL
jgi:hypothetical protein